MSENESKREPLWEGIMAKDGEAINRALEDVRQALDAWVFEPANWNSGIAAEVTMTLSELYPEHLVIYIQERMLRSLRLTHVATLRIEPERIEMKHGRNTERVFRTVQIKVKVC